MSHSSGSASLDIKADQCKIGGFFSSHERRKYLWLSQVTFLPLPLHRKHISSPSEGETAPNSSNCLWRFSLGEGCRFSPPTQQGHHPSSEGAAWRKTTGSSGSADGPRGRFFRRQEALEASTQQRCEKRRGKEAEDKPSQALNTFEQEFLHSAPQLEEERVWPSSPPPPAKAEGLSSGCFIPGPSLARYFFMQKNYTRGCA